MRDNVSSASVGSEATVDMEEGPRHHLRLITQQEQNTIRNIALV